LLKVYRPKIFSICLDGWRRYCKFWMIIQSPNKELLFYLFSSIIKQVFNNNYDILFVVNYCFITFCVVCSFVALFTFKKISFYNCILLHRISNICLIKEKIRLSKIISKIINDKFFIILIICQLSLLLFHYCLNYNLFFLYF